MQSRRSARCLAMMATLRPGRAVEVIGLAPDDVEGDRVSGGDVAAMSADRLLSDEDGAPVEAINDGGRSRCLLVCDHASNRVPMSLGTLGLDPARLEQHIAWDIGAAAMTRRLAERLDAAAVLAGFSRLVVDCNRYLHDPAAFVAASDGVPVPGNAALDEARKQARAAAIHRPYHDTIAALLARRLDEGRIPVLIAIHTMTRQMGGHAPRPQQVTVCWSLDGRLAEPVLASLRARGDFVVGDNVPYGLDLGEDYTVPEHAMRRGLPHLQFETRQDLVVDEAGARLWADRLFEAIAPALAVPEASSIERFWTPDAGGRAAAGRRRGTTDHA